MICTCSCATELNVLCVIVLVKLVQPSFTWRKPSWTISSSCKLYRIFHLMSSPLPGMHSWLLSCVSNIYPKHINSRFCIYLMFFLARGLDCCTDTFMASPCVRMVNTVDLLNPNVLQQPVHLHWLQFFEVISSFLSKIIITVSLIITDRMTLAQQLTTHQNNGTKQNWQNNGSGFRKMADMKLLFTMPNLYIPLNVVHV